MLDKIKYISICFYCVKRNTKSTQNKREALFQAFYFSLPNKRLKAIQRGLLNEILVSGLEESGYAYDEDV